MKLYVHGFPGLYGGAQTELHHQLPVWRDLGFEVHFIPSHRVQSEPLYGHLQRAGFHVHEPNQFEVIEHGAPVLGFCSRPFLNNIDTVRQFTDKTIFINCMTWLFEEEKQRMAEGKIKAFLYQNEDVRKMHMPWLRTFNMQSKAKFMTFVPYFDASQFPFLKREPRYFFGCGRISRQDADKFSSSTLWIYENIVAPKPKIGMFLGFDHRSQAKVGIPPFWIMTAKDHTKFSQRVFYEHCDVVVQSTDTVENWPRIGLEAMASGSVLIVDKRGGWTRMVEHGKTGWLCKTPQDFVYYASKMAYEPEYRDAMSIAALKRQREISSMEASKESWKRVFEEVM